MVMLIKKNNASKMRYAGITKEQTFKQTNRTKTNLTSVVCVTFYDYYF